MNTVKQGISSFTLHLLAMFFMLLDHSWATIVPGNQWMTCVGRLAFPIFAFMIAEGFHYTRNVEKYMLRMLLFAIISEVPFNLMYGGSVFYPLHQNVMWTFLMALACMVVIDRMKKEKLWLAIIIDVVVCLWAFIISSISILDYFGYGVLMVLIFHFFRGKKWYHYLGQFLGLFFINWFGLAGQVYPVEVLGHTLYIEHQGLALLALPIIWLYQGKQGPYNKVIKYSFYAFYPVHLLILGLLVYGLM